MFPLGSGSARLDRDGCHRTTRVRWLTLGLWGAPLAGTVMKDGRLWSVSDPGIMDRWACGGLMRGMHWYKPGLGPRQSTQNSTAVLTKVTMAGGRRVDSDGLPCGETNQLILIHVVPASAGSSGRACQRREASVLLCRKNIVLSSSSPDTLPSSSRLGAVSSSSLMRGVWTCPQLAVIGTLSWLRDRWNVGLGSSCLSAVF
jgi:hypothetical protein